MPNEKIKAFLNRSPIFIAVLFFCLTVGYWEFREEVRSLHDRVAVLEKNARPLVLIQNDKHVMSDVYLNGEIVKPESGVSE